MKQNIAILLTCHNRINKTILCLDSLYISIKKLSSFNVDLFLVDDGSSDGTSDKIRTLFPKANIIQGDGSLYWNRGMFLAWNTAVQKMRYDFYLWINDDTIIKELAIEILLLTSEKFENKNLVIGTTMSNKNSPKITYGGRDYNDVLIIPNSKPRLCHHFNGNMVLIPDFVFKKVGFNDPFFHHSLGDFDYGLRALKIGIKSYVAPDVLGYCDIHENLPNWCNPEKSLNERLAFFRSPLGHNPEEFFVFEKRHHGLLLAVLHYITNHLRVFFPFFWIIFKKKEI